MRVYDDAKPYQRRLMSLAETTAEQQNQIALQNQRNAQSQFDYYTKTFQPIERQTAMDAVGAQWLSPAQQTQLMEALRTGDTATINTLTQAAREGAAQQAMGQAQISGNNAAAQQTRGLTRMGGDPNRMAAYSAQLANNQTALQTGAANQARTQATNQGIALRSGVANFGRNMPNTAGQAYGLATQAGSAGVNSMNTGLQSGLPGAQFAAGGYGGLYNAAGLQQTGALGMGGLMNNGFATQMSGYNGQQASNGAGLAGLGQLAGSVLGSEAGSAWLFGTSDPRLKENIVRVGTTVHGLGLYEFNYIGEDGTRYRGVMADEVEKVMPEAVRYDSEGYMLVDYGMLGIQMEEV
jgi:hypothetical protein